MLAYTLVILVLGAVGILVARRYRPGVTRRGGRNVALLETTYLGPRKAVHLLQVGERRFLVSSSRDGVSMPTDVTAAFGGAYEQHADAVAAAQP